MNKFLDIFRMAALNFVMLLLSTTVSATTYYVSTSTSSASDGNSGTQLDKPLKSIHAGLNKLRDGDTLLLKSGDKWTVNDRLIVTPAKVTISSYGSGSKPIIDANWSIPSSIYENLIDLRGDYSVFSNIHLQKSGGKAVGINGNYSVVKNVTVEGSIYAGISVYGASNALITGNTISGANTGYPQGKFRIWGGAISIKSGYNFTVTDNVVKEGWGEGIGVWWGSKKGIIKNNNIFSTHAVGIYINQSAFIDIVGNNVVGLNNSKYFRVGDSMGPGIALNNEKSGWEKGVLGSDDITNSVFIYGNTVVNTEMGLAFWGEYYATNFKNIVVAQNNFIDNRVGFSSGSDVLHTGTQMINNAFASFSDSTRDGGSPSSARNIYWDGNYYSSAAPGAFDAMTENHHVVGGIKLKKMSGWTLFTSPTQFSESLFGVLDGSSTKGTGIKKTIASFMTGTYYAGGNIGADQGGGVITTLAPLPPSNVSVQ